MLKTHSVSSGDEFAPKTRVILVRCNVDAESRSHRSGTGWRLSLQHLHVHLPQHTKPCQNLPVGRSFRAQVDQN